MCLRRRREGKEVEDEAGKSEPEATFLSETENINSVRKYPIKFMLMITLVAFNSTENKVYRVQQKVKQQQLT